MKKSLCLIAVLIGLAFYCGFLVVKTNRLEARLEKLETAGVDARGADRPEYVAAVERRVDRLEKDVTALENELEKKIVRQALDGNLQEKRDIPPGF